MKSYKGDPYWTTAKFKSVCTCGQTLHLGNRIYYYPRTKTAMCEHCGEQGEATFQAAAFDEATYNRE